MPEDQNVDADAWKDGAVRLFKRSGWVRIGSTNLDVLDVNRKKRGIDAMFSYQDGFGIDLHQGVFMDAKRYETKSLSENELHEWLTVIHDKVASLHNSPGLLDTYPATQQLTISTGLIACWFHDTEKYPQFRERLSKWLTSLKVPQGRVDKDHNLRVFFLDNSRISRLASLLDALDAWKNAAPDGSRRETAFYYPSSAFQGNPVRSLPVLNLEYMFSQFIFVKGKTYRGSDVETTDIVFYFGELSMNSFKRLASALVAHQMISSENPLLIYKYREETSTYRKIHDDIVKLMQGLGAKSGVEVKNMLAHEKLPPWILDGE